MTDRNDGGPAFPVAEEHQHHATGERYTINHFGISVRDYFAAAALKGLLASGMHHWPKDGMAKAAGEYADAMLVERAKP